MNLISLFKKDYLMQNIKKSKTAIILIAIVLPIFTALSLVMRIDGATPKYIQFIDISGINIILMYILPIILSVTLFGYIYKKNSVDFMGSMPISRKSIFVTNTIGGIGIIILTQVLTLLVTLAIKMVADQAVIFSGMILDIFVMQTIAYIFVFAITNLAMSVSGNTITQIIVTMLILFLIPFTVAIYNEFDIDKMQITSEDGRIIEATNEGNEITSTVPSMLFQPEYKYSNISIVKMSILSLLYIGIGLIAFSKRKMEKAGESFESEKTHLIVKGLTLTPFIAMLVMLNETGEYSFISFISAIMIIYYFIYDLITNKKVKFGTTILALLITVISLTLLYRGEIQIAKSIQPKMEIEGAKEIILYIDNKEYKVKDKEKIEKIINAIKSSKKEKSHTNIKIKGRKIGLDIEKQVLDNILSEYSIETEINSKEKIILINDVNTNITGKEIDEKLYTAIKNVNAAEYLKKSNEANWFIEVIGYKNHSIQREYIPININNEIESLIIQSCNENAIAKAKEYQIVDIDIEIYNGKIMEERRYVYFIDQIKEYIIENENAIVDTSGKYVKISATTVKERYDKIEQITFFSNNVEGLTDILEKIKEDDSEVLK